MFIFKMFCISVSIFGANFRKIYSPFLEFNFLNVSFLAHLALGQVSYCHHLASVFVINNFCKLLFLWNYRIDLHETYNDCSLEYPAQNDILDF